MHSEAGASLSLDERVRSARHLSMKLISQPQLRNPAAKMMITTNKQTNNKAVIFHSRDKTVLVYFSRDMSKLPVA